MNPLLPLFWLVNGALAVAFFLADHLALLALAPALGWLAATSPPAYRPWVLGTAGLCLLAALLVPAPVPAILAAMALAGTLAVQLDRFNPGALRWRVNGGLALYALAGLAFALYGAYAARLDPQSWARLLAPGEAGAVVAQGRSFVTTIATWGLWLILPLGYFSLLAQGMLAHPPLQAGPADLIHTVRARGREER